MSAFLVSVRKGKAQKAHIRADPKASIPITFCGKILNEYIEVTGDLGEIERCQRCLPFTGLLPRREP